MKGPRTGKGKIKFSLFMGDMTAYIENQNESKKLFE